MTTSLNDEGIGARATRELAHMAAVFTAGEAEIAQAYFEGPGRSKDTDIMFLTSQAGREFSSGLHILQDAIERRQRDPGSLDRHWFNEALFKGQQEMNHGNLCADILERLTGQTVNMAELFRYDLFNGDPTAPNNQEQTKLSHMYQEQEQRIEPWAQLVQHNSGYGILEGGGCGMFYSASRISGSDVNERLARAFQIVLDDERGHGPPNLMEVDRFITTEQELENVKALLRVRGTQRLRFRREQFSNPVSDERITEIADGKIDVGIVVEIWGPAFKELLKEPGNRVR